MGVSGGRRKLNGDLIVLGGSSRYAERTLAGMLPTIADEEAAARRLYDAVAGAGPLQRYLDDPEIEEIWINERLRDG